MPYKTVDELPKGVKGNLPAHAQEIYLAAYNSASAKYGDDESRCAAIAWSAVKTKYKQDDKGNWVAKEAAPPAENVIAQSVDVVEIACPNCKGDRFEPEGAHLKCISCGTLVEKKSEVSMEAKFARMIQEQATRKADPDRIRKVTELYQSEASEEEKIKALDEVLDWLKVQEVMKTEDGVQYPASAFAYVPDSDKPSEWKLRLWENPTDKVTRKQLGAAAAALSPGGFRGQRVDIPREDLPSVKRKIREQYRKLDVPDEEIPRWVQESTRRDLLYNYTPLNEADIGSKGIARVVVIKPGFGNPVDNHYYPAETLSRDYSVFEGVKMYADHQTEQEEKQRPEGSIRQWVASLKNVRFEEGVGIVGDAVIIEPWLQQKLATLRDQKLLSEMGISIRAAGAGTKGKIDGKDTNIVERITRVRSVDFVTEAGAGGGVLLYETEKEFDIDIVTIEALKERRPDLVKIIENDIKEKTLKEVKRAMELEDKVKELEGQVATLATERDAAVTKLSEAEKAQRKAEAKSKIDEAISKSDLPEVSKQKLAEKFKDAESADIGDAIKAETDYVNALKEASKPKNLGESKPDPKKSRDDLKESFKKMHPEWTDGQVEAAVKGR